MTKILHAVKGGLLSYCDKVYSRGNINQKHRIGGVMVRVLADDDEVRFILDQHAELDFYSASSQKQQSEGRNVTPFGHIILIPSQPIYALSLRNAACL
jgi:hypothetical protein